MKRLQADDGQFLRVLNDPLGSVHELLCSIKARFHESAVSPGFALCLAGSETSDQEGVSAAGADSVERRFTPQRDADVLFFDRMINLSVTLPVSPQGVVSPVVISHACQAVLKLPMEIYDCGTFYPPNVRHITINREPAKHISSGQALDYDMVIDLFESGRRLGLSAQAKNMPFIVLGECVPGGTTTAYGVLTALGYSVSNLLSSSLPEGNNALKAVLVNEGLERARVNSEIAQADPLRACAAVGDPMQPFVAGYLLGAAPTTPVLLGGGSQMLAVWALAKALCGDPVQWQAVLRNSCVLTTKWVGFDNGGDTQTLSKLVGAPFACACPDFNKSQHQGLRLFEEGHVKEGVAAGALMVLNHLLLGTSGDQLVEAIDKSYEYLTRQINVMP